MDLWFKHTRPLSFTRGVFILGVPNFFVKEWLEKKYVGDIEDIFQEITGSSVSVLVKIDGYMYRLMTEMKDGRKRGSQSSPDGVAAQASRKQDNQGLFVVRPENRVACSAFDKTLRDAPASTFNPLYFYGPIGIGKTHLIKSFIVRAKRTPYYSEVRVMDALRFAREFNAAARVGNRVRFRGGILRSDLLVLEEVHRLRGKVKTQLELLSILKYLVERQRQVVISSRHHPRDIEMFEDSLASFLLSGMVISIFGYSMASMTEILSHKLKEGKITVPPTLVEAVANISSIGIEEKLALIERTVSLAVSKNEIPTAAFFKEHFPEYSTGTGGEDGVEQVIDIVAKVKGVARDQIASNCKIRKAVEARYLVIYLAATHLKTSSRRICRWLGDISPSIVPYAKRKVDMRRKDDAEFNKMVLELQSEIEGGQRYLF